LIYRGCIGEGVLNYRYDRHLRGRESRSEASRLCRNIYLLNVIMATCLCPRRFFEELSGIGCGLYRKIELRIPTIGKDEFLIVASFLEFGK